MDPELEAFVPLLPKPDLSDPVGYRKLYAELAASRPVPRTPEGVTVEDLTVPAEPDVAVRIFRPREPLGALIWLHGGGWTVGGLDADGPWAATIAAEAEAVVISVDYRLAPENPFPAALDDTYAVLAWAAGHAAELGFDPARLAVGGHSAGGALAAGLALRARDEQGPPIHFQLLSESTLDDRSRTWSARNFTDTPWNTREVREAAWRNYLGGRPGTPYAAPARAEDLSGLPPAYVTAAEFDPNRDEDIAYAQRLLQAGVPVELHHFPGTFHGSLAIGSTGVSQRQVAQLCAALRHALASETP